MMLMILNLLLSVAIHFGVDTRLRIAYPLTEVKVRGISNVKSETTEVIRRYDS